MAYRRDITSADKVFYDTDRLLKYLVVDGDLSDDSAALLERWASDPSSLSSAEQTALTAAVTMLDCSTFAMSWVLRKKVNSPDPALITKTVGFGVTVTGTFDTDPITNTQYVEVMLEDTDTYDPNGSPSRHVKPGTYAYALKRTDDGSEGILAWGSFTFIQAAAWE